MLKGWTHVHEDLDVDINTTNFLSFILSSILSLIFCSVSFSISENSVAISFLNQ